MLEGDELHLQKTAEFYASHFKKCQQAVFQFCFLGVFLLPGSWLGQPSIAFLSCPPDN